MSTGLLALLDDIAALAKVAAASLDDAAAQATKAGAKATGIVIDDAAVTPRYVVGFAAERELPMIWKITVGSLRNKLLILLPGALVLSAFAPWWAIPVLLLFGGAYLCLEGYHKVMDLVGPHTHGHDAKVPDPDAPVVSAAELEKEKVASAVRTDFILSAEIMFITLGALTTTDNPSPIWLQAMVLAVVGIGMTVLVYGVVALIVKADDVGLHMAQKSNTGVGRAFGRGLVDGMPTFLKALSHIGMVAMLWVGGGIVIHELYLLGFKPPEPWVHRAADAVGHVVPAIEGLAKWLTSSAIYAVIGLAIGAVVDPLVKHAIAPAWRAATRPLVKKPA
jgi:uncharacterized protein